MATESGYSNQKKIGKSQYKTIHNVGSDKFAENVVTKGLVERQTTSIALTAVAVSTDKLSVYLQVPSHGALRSGEVIRFYTGVLATVELDIISVIDANSVEVLNVMDTIPQIGDTVRTAYFRTPQFDSNGSVTVTPGPIQFKKSGVDTTVTNTEPLPVYTPANPLSKARIDFSTTNVTNAAWVQLISSVGATDIKKAQIFMSSGEPLEIAFGAAASEVSKAYIFPGGNGFLDITIPAGTRLSVRAVNAVTVNSGEILANFLG